MTAAAAGCVVLGNVDEIPLGEGREYALPDRRLAVFRLRSGSVAVTDAACPHRGGPLVDGIVGLDGVVCPLHARRFALGDGAEDDSACPLRRYAAHLDGEGRVVVTLT